MAMRHAPHRCTGLGINTSEPWDEGRLEAGKLFLLCGWNNRIAPWLRQRSGYRRFNRSLHTAKFMIVSKGQFSLASVVCIKPLKCEGEQRQCISALRIGNKSFGKIRLDGELAAG